MQVVCTPKRVIYLVPIQYLSSTYQVPISPSTGTRNLPHTEILALHIARCPCCRAEVDWLGPWPM